MKEKMKLPSYSDQSLDAAGRSTTINNLSHASMVPEKIEEKYFSNATIVWYQKEASHYQYDSLASTHVICS